MLEVLLFSLGLVLLYFGGELLVKGAVFLGERMGMSSLVVGLTLVAFGTSAPELAVSLDASLTDHPDIAVANILGSNLANLGLVAGITAIMGRILLGRELATKDLPVMLLSMLLLVWFLADSSLSRLEAFVLMTTLAAYVSYRIIRGNKDQATDNDRSTTQPPSGLTRAIGGLLAGLVMLGVGGDLLVTAAADLATRLKVSETLIGFSVVAIGTSLPEIATSIAAVRLGHGEIAIGNIVGSNIWNSLGVLGLTAAIAPLSGFNIPWHLMTAMLGISILTIVLAISVGRLERRWGVAFLGGYFAYLVYSI